MNKIVQVALATPLPKLYDYLCDPHVFQKKYVGCRVKVPFNHRDLVGVIWEIADHSKVDSDKLKFVTELIDTSPVVGKQLHQLLSWAAAYYHHPIGEVIFSALPTNIRKGKPAKLGSADSFPDFNTTIESKLALNLEQQTAFAAIQKKNNQFSTFLLNGITGSGKTEVYLWVIAEVLKKNQQALILVPEIGLTPQTVARFQARFSVPVMTYHSGLTEKQKLNTWLWARSGEAKIIIGTRSAVFMPCNHLGVIIIDESHDLSFKQQEGWRYSARDIAVKRGSLENIPVILGTATPTLETLANVERGRFQALYLHARAADAALPQFKVIDIRSHKLQSGLSIELIELIQSHLDRENQVLIFLNRRGFAPTLICHQCGWSVKCKRCDAHMTLHMQPHYLHCHHCSATQPVEKICPACDAGQLVPLGLGTERLEQGLQKIFNDYKIIRVDRDTTRGKGELAKKLSAIQSGEGQLLLGTQMLAKGHHFPDITLAVILDIDNGLYSGEFRACERLAQLIVQVAGRSGRADKPGEVILQTHCPEHPLFQVLLTQGYNAYAGLLLQEREQAGLPPYSHLALLRAEATENEVCREFLDFAKKLFQSCTQPIYCLGPIPAPLTKKADRYRMQLLIQTTIRQNLQQVLKESVPKLSKYRVKKKLRWSLDIDPQELY